MADTLSEADVQRLITNRSGEARAETAAKVADAFGSGALTPQERQIAEQIFRLMVKDAEVIVRQSLSVHLKSSGDLPHDLAVTLAKDVEEVSLPFLESSTVLTDADLIEIVRSAGAAKQTAVAKRAHVSGEVASALIDHGRTGDVVATLAGNTGAELNEKQINQILDKHGDNAKVTNSLVARPQLSLAVSERLVSLVSQSMQDYLVSQHFLSEELAADLVLQARERATISLLPPGAKSTDVIDFVEQLKSGNRLTPTLVLRALCTGDVAFFEAAMAVLSGIPIVNARTLIHDSGELGLKSIYDRTRLPADLFPIMRAAFDAARELDYDGGDRDRQRFASKVIERVLTKVEQNLDQANVDYLLKRLQQLAA